MKHYVMNMLTIAVAAMVACQKQPVAEGSAANDPVVENPVVEEPQSSSYVYTINASTDDLDVKSDYDSDGKFTWSTGDAISVLFHDNTQPDELKNKFFTLTLVSGANNKTATFSGEITTGYTIGASDGDESDKKIWALFPASTQHSYTVGELPKFYVQPEVDFTATNFSANIPMYALNAAEGGFVFSNIASTYKFIVNNIKDGVSKVKFKIYNQQTRGLSGLWSLYQDGSLFINYEYATPGSEKSTLTYINNVTSNQAVFYVSYHGKWDGLQPVITIINPTTEAPIKSFTASKSIAPNAMNEIKPITLDLSDGDYFVPAIIINGDMSDWDTIDMYPEDDLKDAFPGEGTRIVEWKAASDAKNVYFYYKITASEVETAGMWGAYIVTGFDTDNNSTTSPNSASYGLGVGFEYRSIAYPFKNDAGNPVTFYNAGETPCSSSNIKAYDFSSSSVGKVSTAGCLVGSYAYVETVIPRSLIGSPVSNKTIRVRHSCGYTPSAEQTITLAATE